MTRFHTLAAVLLAFTLTACDSAAPESTSLAGIWEGQITHPNPDFSGTLTLTVTQAGDVIGGDARWRYPGESISGVLIGTVPDSGPVTYTLDFGTRGQYLHEGTVRGGVLSGTWVSASRRAISGTMALDRQ
ncbi:MAG: hypothetical protein AAF170_16555 [Bacteroidota bacterium]